MPLLVRELVIRAVVSESPGSGSGTTAGEPGAPAADSAARERLVADVVAEVLRILQRERER